MRVRVDWLLTHTVPDSTRIVSTSRQNTSECAKFAILGEITTFLGQ